MNNLKFTVFFEDPFWVGVFERLSDGKYSTSKVVFGPEPKNQELFNLVNNLPGIRFSQPLPVEGVKLFKATNPKRMQRQIRQEMGKTGVSTKARESMRLHYESNKQERKILGKIENEEIEKRKFQMKQEKKKEKHRGH
ncbi:MAG: YjdF family protein [Syntrophomonas sp.]